MTVDDAFRSINEGRRFRAWQDPNLQPDLYKRPALSIELQALLLRAAGNGALGNFDHLGA